MQLWYDREGNPITREKAEELLMRGLEYSRVDRTRVTSEGQSHDGIHGPKSAEFEIATVWLGLNRQWGDGPPLIFETMVIGQDGPAEVTRTSSEVHARRAHDAEVRRLKSQMCCPVVAQVPDEPQQTGSESEEQA